MPRRAAGARGAAPAESPSLFDAAESASEYADVGDVNFEDVRRVASLITPVPRGVGPMTIAMLLRNTVTAAQRSARA